MVALTSDVFARSFNDFYQHIPAFGASLRIIGNIGGCMLTEAASRLAHTCAAAGRAAVKAEEPKREASGALLR